MQWLDDAAWTLTLLRHPRAMRWVGATPLLPLLRRTAIQRWARRGRPTPPPSAYKHHVILDHARRFQTRVLVETGTYVGLTVAACLRAFHEIYSVELDRALYEEALRKFAPFSHVRLVQGDSAEALGKILAVLEEPALFWLDAHYSGGITAHGDLPTPVMRELEAISAHPVRGHVVLIDDAREFGRVDGYPTVATVRALVGARRPDWTMTVEDDIMRVVPTAPQAGSPPSGVHSRGDGP
jgi:hypothetical protein